MRHEHHLPPPPAARAMFVLGERHPGCTSFYCPACQLCIIDEEGVPIEPHECPVEARAERQRIRDELLRREFEAAAAAFAKAEAKADELAAEAEAPVAGEPSS